MKDGRLVYARGFGRADLEHDVPITPRTAFHLASLSKQFIAAAVALLILDGRLSLDTPVERFFPQVRKFGADLRIKHLLYFTSGLPEYTSLPRESGIWYSGGDLDSSTFMARLPQLRLAVICLSNMPMGNAQEKAKEVLAVLLGPE